MQSSGVTKVTKEMHKDVSMVSPLSQKEIKIFIYKKNATFLDKSFLGLFFFCVIIHTGVADTSQRTKQKSLPVDNWVLPHLVIFFNTMQTER